MKNGNCPSGVIAAPWSHFTRTGPSKLSSSTAARRSTRHDRRRRHIASLNTPPRQLARPWRILDAHGRRFGDASLGHPALNLHFSLIRSIRELLRRNALDFPEAFHGPKSTR